MLKIAVILISFTAPIFNSFAFDATIKGFIALDMLVLEKQEARKQELETGIGTLDLKVYATQDDFSAKLKLDLDDSRLGDAYNIFEEATVSYKFMPDHQLILGKGKVPFHQMHWGVINSSFIDGGSIMGTEHGLYDLDNRLLLSWRFGGFSRGFFNYLTYWGESQRPQTNRDGTIRYSNSTANGQIQYENSKTFSSKEQAGIANQFEWFINRQLSVSVAGMYYYNDLNPKNNWAFDLATQYSSRDLEVWAEYVRAFISTNDKSRYPTFRKNEHLVQLGAEFYLTELYNFLVNAEAAFVNDQRHFVSGNTFDNDGKKYEVDTYKLEAGVKIKLQKMAFITLGTHVEKQNEVVKTNGTDTSKFAYQLASKFSFWF